MGTTEDIASYMGVVFPCLLVLCVVLVYSFAERGNSFPWHTYVSITICYFVSLGIILLVPIDIATIVADRTSTLSGSDPTYDANTQRISAAYSSFFTMVIIFAQVLMVFEEYYNADGNFTILSRMWSSFKYLTRDMVAALVVGGITLGLLVHFKVMPSDSGALQLSAVIITNTIYEFFLMFLLGYGLIEYPRRYWLDADIQGQLLRTQIKAASDFADIRDGQVSMSIEYANAIKTNEKLSLQSNTASTKNQLTDAMEIILSELPKEGFNATRSGEVACDPKSKEITITSLGALRSRITLAKSKYRMALAKVEKTKLKAYYLEDLLDARRRNDPSEPGHDGVQKISWSLTATQSTTFGYWWHLRYKPWLLRLVAVGWGCLSIFSFIGVVGSYSSVNVTNTPYFKAVHDSGVSTGGIVIFIFVTFGYTVYITFWSLFQMRLGGMMDLVVGETTPLSLSFNARMIARLAAPLVFFYLGWLAENGISDGQESWTFNQAPTAAVQMTSSFANFYQLQQVAFIRRSFGTIYPTILIIFLVMVVTDFYNWLCVRCGANWAQFGIPRVTAEQEREGKRRLVDDKKKTLNAARRKRMLSYILGQTKRPEGEGANEDDDGAAPAGGGLFTLLWGPSKSLAESDLQSSVQADERARPAGPPARDITPPSALGGMVEMKGRGRVFSSWKEWWAEVRAPGVVYFFTARAPPPNFIDAAAPPPIELLDVIDFQVDTAAPLQLHLVTSEGQVTVRFKSGAECDTWRRLLIEWKDFSVDHGREYMARHARRDVEKGSSPPSSSSSSSAASLARSPAASATAAVALLGAASSLGDERPPPLECYVEYKTSGSSSFLSADWQRRYLRVEERSASLVLTKSNSPTEKPLAVIHLPEVADICSSAEYGQSYFDVVLDSGGHKFRAPSDAEGARLVAGLNCWKEYLLLNMTA